MGFASSFFRKGKAMGRIFLVRHVLNIFQFRSEWAKSLLEIFNLFSENGLIL
jgi:hypothetical protein